MNSTLQTVSGLLGGLAVFIFGMNMMSECLQKAAGEKMKKILSMLTKNPVLGVLAGALTTAVLQSSSATTVMAIGFVSAGLMSLPQAISIIFGANIGTTMTAQIIAFKITDYIYVFIFAGFILNFISKSEKWKNIGQTIFAFGLLFLGIETMGGVMKPLAKSQIFVDLIGKVADVPVLGVIVGTVMTLVVQSSSATIAVLQNFAQQAGPDGASIIGLAGAIPVLLGDNIGTTITALLASIGQSKDAKRTALAHCLFNISGCLLFIWIVKPYAAFIQNISPSGPEVEVISRQIANAHTGFNLVMTLIWTPFIWLMVKIVMTILPDKEDQFEKKAAVPAFLDEKLLNQPVAALHLVSKEIERCGELVREILEAVEMSDDNNAESTLEKICDKSDVVDSLGSRITDYLAKMFSEGVLNEEQASQATSVLYILSDIGRIGTLSRQVSEEIIPKKKIYSREALRDLKKSVGTILEMYTEALDAIKTGNSYNADELQNNKLLLTKQSEKMRKSHLDRVSKGKCDAALTAGYCTILHDIDRMGNSCVNLAENALRNTDFKAFLENEEESPALQTV